MKTTLTAIILLITLLAGAQAPENAVVVGNQYYRQRQFDMAELQYKKALQQNPADAKAQYNLASALYQQKKYAEAANLLKQLSTNTTDSKIKETAYYNKGVVHTKEKDLEKSIDAYKAALRIDPADQQARENLQKALLEKKKKQQEQKQQQQKQPQSSMSKREAERKLKLLQDKEKQLQERLQNKGQKGSAMPKDW